MIKGTCPGCYFTGEILAFVVEIESRETVAEALRIPAEIGHGTVLRYLNLFRPKGRALAHSKATRLLRDLANDIEARKVNRRGRDWAAPVAHWKLALDSMLEAQDRLTLPLKNHHYLHEIVAGLANSEEAVTERKTEERRQHGHHRTEAPLASPVVAGQILGDLMAQLKGRRDA